ASHHVAPSDNLTIDKQWTNLSKPCEGEGLRMRKIDLAARVGLGMVLLAGRLWAQVPEGPKPLVMTAENLMAGDARHKTNPKAALPGDVIRYRLTFTNLRSDSIRNVQFNDPLPTGLH